MDNLTNTSEINIIWSIALLTAIYLRYYVSKQYLYILLTQPKYNRKDFVTYKNDFSILNFICIYLISVLITRHNNMSLLISVLFS